MPASLASGNNWPSCTPRTLAFSAVLICGWRASMRIVLRMSPAEVARVFNQSTVECGASEPFLVVCPDGVVDMPDGEVLALGMTLVAPAPDGNTEQSYIY